MGIAVALRRSTLPVEAGPTTRGSMTLHPSNPSDRFPTTHRTRVVAARARGSTQEREALGELCNAYWYPLYMPKLRKSLGPPRSPSSRPCSGMRKRFRSLVREQIAATLENPTSESVEDELGSLFAALAG